MGLLRLVLALWVVAMHGGGLFGIVIEQAWVAVQVFFIVSGFYMSLILHEKYAAPGTTKLFYSQRWLRLVPPYLAVLALTLAASGLAWGWWGHAMPPLRTWLDHHQSMTPGTTAFLTAANALLIGLNETLFLGLDPAAGRLFWTTDFTLSDPMVWHFLAVPQAWSLELEIMFYALAPLLVRRSLPVLGAVLAASLAARATCYFILGLPHDPWTYRFFPNELALFLLGAVAYRMYRAPWRARASEGLWIWPLFILLFAVTLAFPFIPVRGQLKAWPYFALVTITLPFLFAATKNWRWDRAVGELSYPVYLIHFLVIWIGQATLPAAWLPHTTAWAIPGSLLAAAAIHHTVTAPVDRWRVLRAV